mgnify:CR=1 FL=1
MEGLFDFKDFIIRILRKWRLIIILSLLTGILLGGGKFINGNIQLKGTTAQTDKTDNESKENIENIEESIELLDEGISAWDAYYANSKLMKIDSYNAERYSIIFTVEDTFNKETSLSIASACEKAVTSGMYYEDIEKVTGIPVEELKELIFIKSDDGAVEIKGYEYEEYDMETAVESLFEKLQQDFNKKYNNRYSFTETAKGHFKGKDEDLISLKDVLIANGERYISESSSRERVLENLKAETPVAEITQTTVLKSTIKFFVVGCFGGALLAIILGFFSDMMSKKLYDEKELKEEFHLKCLGGAVILPQKKNVVDRLIDNLYRKKIELSDAEWVDYIFSRVKSEELKEKSLLITGSILPLKEKEKLNRLVEKIKEEGIEVILSNSVVSDAEVIRDLERFYNIVLVERIGSSDLNLVKEEIEILKGLNKNILGFILV